MEVVQVDGVAEVPTAKEVVAGAEVVVVVVEVSTVKEVVAGVGGVEVVVVAEVSAAADVGGTKVEQQPHKAAHRMHHSSAATFIAHPEAATRAALASSCTVRHTVLSV